MKCSLVISAGPTLHAKLRILAQILLIVIAAVACRRAFAGSPPLITDDPETPGYHGWEINTTGSFGHAGGQVSMQNPLFDINYGLTSDRDQVKVEFAWVSLDSEGHQEAEWGISDLLVGYKYRFLNEEDTCSGWMASFYPQVSCPIGDADRGLGSGNTQLFIPFEFQKNFEKTKSWINPEIGYNIVLDKDDQNSWKFGLAYGKEETDKLELEGEVGTFIFDGHRGEPDNPFFNFGFEYRCSKHVVFLGSAGRSFRSSRDGTPDFFCLLGFQFLLGKAAEEGKEGEQEGGENFDGDSKKGEARMPSFLHSMATADGHYLVNPAAETSQR
jgi:hypothetical protein